MIVITPKNRKITIISDVDPGFYHCIYKNIRIATMDRYDDSMCSVIDGIIDNLEAGRVNCGVNIDAIALDVYQSNQVSWLASIHIASGIMQYIKKWYHLMPLILVHDDRG